MIKILEEKRIPVENTELELLVKHPQFNKEVIERTYKNSKFLLSLNGTDIYYQEEPHPKGSNYFGIGLDRIKAQMFDTHCFYIFDALPMLENGITSVLCSDGKTLIYSNHVHDYVSSPIEGDNNFIDGGTNYVRCILNATLVTLVFKDGKLYVTDVR